ncbi:MAG: hypothetical protein ABSG64_09660 [Solirubrobacteraceae bacterium]|jgi:hypothetical protein
MSGRDGDPALAPYAALIRIAELELELAGEGRYVEIAQLDRQRQQVLRSLPAKPPRGARDYLERALAIQRRVTIELLRRREQVLLSLRRLELGTRTARGYARTMAVRRGGRVYEKA